MDIVHRRQCRPFGPTAIAVVFMCEIYIKIFLLFSHIVESRIIQLKSECFVLLKFEDYNLNFLDIVFR